MDAASKTTPRLSLTVSLDTPRSPAEDVDTWCDVARTAAFEPVHGRLTARQGEAMSFRFELDVDHEILWTGADVERLTLFSSTAVARFETPGEHVVRAEIYSLDNRLIATLSAFVDVLLTTSDAPRLRHTNATV